MPLPLACTLGADAQARRVEGTRALTSRSLRGWEATERGASLRFDSAADAEVRDLVAAESLCCSFLEFELADEGDLLRLEVAGPPEARPVIAELFGISLD